MLGADKDGVELPMETSRFNTFAPADYEAIYAKLSGEIAPVKDVVDSAAQLDVQIVQVNLIG